MKTKYETVLIARQDYSTAQVEALNEKLGAMLTAAGAEVFKTEYWGLRGLSYRIKKNRKGHYTLLCVEADKDVAAELDRQLALNEDVLRHMIVKVESFDEGQSAILQRNPRDERPDRRRGGGQGGGRRD